RSLAPQFLRIRIKPSLHQLIYKVLENLSRKPKLHVRNDQTNAAILCVVLDYLVRLSLLDRFTKSVHSCGFWGDWEGDDVVAHLASLKTRLFTFALANSRQRSRSVLSRLFSRWSFVSCLSALMFAPIKSIRRKPHRPNRATRDQRETEII